MLDPPAGFIYAFGCSVMRFCKTPSTPVAIVAAETEAAAEKALKLLEEKRRAAEEQEKAE